MRTILTIVCLIFLLETKAQDIVWHKGSAVMADNSVVVGEIARQSSELLLFRNSENGVAVYPAHKVSSFRYYDEKEDVNRAFITIGRRHFERIVNGRISVLRIQKQFHQEINEKHQELYDFFIVEERKISSIRSFRSKYFHRIKDELSQQLIDYRQFDPNTRHGAVSLIMLYNKTTPVVISKVD